MARKSSKVESALTHIDTRGEARMVDVSAKPATERMAVAEGRVVMSKATLELIECGNAKKGDVLGTARIAGIMAAKRTSDLIPLCHPLALSKVTLEITPDPRLPGCVVRATVKVTGPTGVEMEALTAVAGGMPDDLRHDQGGGARRRASRAFTWSKRRAANPATTAPEKPIGCIYRHGWACS